MTEHILPLLPTGVHPRRLISALVRKHYGTRGIWLRRLAGRYDLTHHQVSRLHREVEIILDATAYRAETRAYECLQRMGVVR